MTTESNTPAVPGPHRLEVEIAGGSTGILPGDIHFKGICDAAEGASCRMWCEHPDCQEGAVSDKHETHPLIDQGQCGLVESLNVDPGMIPEIYDGENTQLRSGPITITPDCDGVTWTYSEPAPPLTRDERAELEEYRRRNAAGHVEYGVQDKNAADGSLGPDGHAGMLTLSEATHIRNLGAGRGFKPVIMHRLHPAPTEWKPLLGPACAPTCRHECPECRMGLGTHLRCDPRCYHHLPPAEG